MRTSRVQPALQRQRMLRVHGLLCLALALLGGERLAAQGTTGAAVQGTVFEPDSVPVGSATVLITNSATGERWQTVTRDNGRFFLEHLSVGGPYRVDVRAIGFAPASRSGMFLSLSQRLTLDVGLVSAALQLEELTVRGTVDPRINAARTGPALSLSDSTIVRLPLPGNREWLVLMTQSPQVSFSPSGFSFAGAHDRLNSVQIDGTSNNDLKGRVGLTGVSELPPEAIQELQVVTAPFDVRYGNLAGGLVNAVTKSGTNRWEGSVFGYLANKGLSGTGPEGARLDAFSRKELALTLGGPIVHDKVAFFLSARGVRRIDPWPVNAPGSDTTAGADSAGVGIRYASLTRFQDILRSTYGVEPGTFNSNPKRDPFFDGFGKLTAQLGVNSRLEVSHEHRTGGFRQDGVQVPGFIALSSFGSYDPFHVDRTRVNWTVAIGTRWTNELLLGRSSTWHHCRPQSTFPQVEAQVDAGGVTAGAQDQCTGQANGQSIWEMTDNLDLAAGTHHLTFGTHNELVHVIDDDGVALEGGGQPHWFFTSLDSLEQGLPDGFVRNLPGPLLPASGRTELRVAQLGFYAQDQWTPTERLTLTGGLRVEIPYLPTAPTLNGELLGTLGINTSRTPGGHLLWSPRLGVNYDVGGRGATYLRGGIGLFEGRPPYVWLEEAYSGTGVQEVFLECFGGDVPAFTLDRAAQPTACGSGEQGTPVITAFDPDFRFPRNLKIVLGMDHRLPWDVVASVDLVHTRGVDQFRVRDANLLGPLGISSGEGGRALYGTIDPDFGFSEPRRVTDAVGPVVQITNDAGDRAYQVGVQLQKHFASGNEVILGYAYTRARDRQDNPGETSRGNLGNSVLDGTWEAPLLGTSLYSGGHKLTLAVTTNLPLKLQLGLTYIGGSGLPFTYIVRGDANADGLDNIDNARNNDPVYVPRDASDITLAEPADFARLDQYIQSEPCLQAQRGRLVRRNSCRNSWEGHLDLRLSKVVPTARGQSLELTADLLNVTNFLNRDWGNVRYTMEDFGGLPNGNRVSLLELVGYDPANGRGIYNVLDPKRNELDVGATLWEVHLGARYTF